MSQLLAKNATVLGISADSVDSHKRFVEKERLNFSLLADTDKKMIAAYGVLAPNGFASRVTFVVGPDGTIREIDRAVNAQFNREGTTLTTRHASNLALLLSDWRARVGQPVPNFSLAGVDGKTVSPLAPGRRATVVLFLSARAPGAAVLRDRLHDLASDPAYKDVMFLALYPNRDETLEAIRLAAPQGAQILAARDTSAKLADHFGATVTPTAWIIDPKGVAVYSGAIGGGTVPAGAETGALKDALDALLAGKPETIHQTKAVGAPIRHAPRPKGK